MQKGHDKKPKSIDQRENDSKQLPKMVSDFYFILDLLGFKFALPTYNLEVKLLIRKWQELRNKGEYKQADQIRKQLQKLDIL